MRFIVPLASLCLLLAACATAEETVSIPHQVAARRPIAGADHIKVVVAAVDGRTTNRGRISTKMNGYGMEMAAIRSKDDVADVVKNALSDELQARGYAFADGGVKVKASVETFYSAFKVGLLSGTAVADVAMTVSVTSADGRQLYSRHIAASGSKQNIQLASGGNAAAALADGLDHALSSLFDDPAFVHALAG